MGTTMTVICEVKTPSGQWAHYTLCEWAQLYVFYAKLAGVRNEDNIEAIAPDRGWPPDHSNIARGLYNHYREDYHSLTWVKPSEVSEAYDYACKESEGCFYEYRFFNRLMPDCIPGSYAIAGFNSSDDTNPDDYVRFLLAFSS